MTYSTTYHNSSAPALPSIRDILAEYLGPSVAVAKSTVSFETAEKNRITFVPQPRLLSERPSPLTSPTTSPLRLPLQFIDYTSTFSSRSRRRNQACFKVNAQPCIPATSTNAEKSVLVNHRRSLASSSDVVPLTNTASITNFPNSSCKRQHVCPVPECGKIFSSPFNLRSHLVVHTGAMPFECPRCGKRFNVISNMRRHCKGHDKSN